MFIHIPKTGGTSIETTARHIHRGNLTVLARVADCCDWWKPKPSTTKCCKYGSPWHLTPDVAKYYFGFQQHRNRTIFEPGLPRWCVVRNPVQRYLSDLAYTHRGNASVPGFGRTTPAETLARIFARGRWHVQWTDELLHKQPQSWYVWDSQGRVQCDCVVAFEKLGLFVDHVWNSASLKSKQEVANSWTGIGSVLSLLYNLDSSLWYNATQVSNETVCYRPQPLVPSGDKISDPSVTVAKEALAVVTKGVYRPVQQTHAIGEPSIQPETHTSAHASVQRDLRIPADSPAKAPRGAHEDDDEHDDSETLAKRLRRINIENACKVLLERVDPFNTTAAQLRAQVSQRLGYIISKAEFQPFLDAALSHSP